MGNESIKKDVFIERSPELLETYNESIERIKSLLDNLNKLFEQIDVYESKKKIFEDLLAGIRSALYQTINQILDYGKTDEKEALSAFDEFMMLLETVERSLATGPEIISKKTYKNSAIYHLVPDKEIKHREVMAVDTLFSKEHIAWNVDSRSQYDSLSVTKAGIRLDYNPLYKEWGGEIDKTKTERVTAVDISGFHVDKIMNQHSPRGHHFTGVFKYKVGLIIPGLARALIKYFDEKGKTVKE